MAVVATKQSAGAFDGFPDSIRRAGVLPEKSWIEVDDPDGEDHVTNTVQVAVFWGVGLRTPNPRVKENTARIAYNQHTMRYLGKDKQRFGGVPSYQSIRIAIDIHPGAVSATRPGSSYEDDMLGRDREPGKCVSMKFLGTEEQRRTAVKALEQFLDINVSKVLRGVIQQYVPELTTEADFFEQRDKKHNVFYEGDRHYGDFDLFMKEFVIQTDSSTLIRQIKELKLLDS